MQHSHWSNSSTGTFALLSTQSRQIQCVIDDVIFFSKGLAIFRKLGSRGVVEKTQQINFMLALFDLCIELLSVVAYADKLHNQAFEEENYCASEERG